MPSQRPAALLASALASALAAPGTGRATPPPRPVQNVYVSLEIFADTLAKRQSPAVAHAWADSVGRAAAARGDRATETAVQLWHGKRYATHEYQYEPSLPYFVQALAGARALRDTFAIATAYARRAWGAQLAGRSDLARADYTQAVRYARAAQLPALEGLSHRGLGTIAKMDGQYDVARRELSAALRQLAEPTFEHLHTRLLL